MQLKALLSILLLFCSFQLFAQKIEFTEEELEAEKELEQKYQEGKIKGREH